MNSYFSSDFQIPKIDPTDQFVPMIELPSRGSNVTVYFDPPNSIGCDKRYYITNSPNIIH